MGFFARARIWFALLFACLQLLDFAQAQETTSPNRSPQVRGENPSPEAKSSPQSQEKKEPERIFGIVPAYTITDERNAPALKSKEKFHLFVSGTLDPFPFVVYAIQAGIEQARDSHSGYGQGAAGYARRFGAALGDGTSARFFSTYAFPSLIHQDPRYFRKGEGSGWSRAGYSISRGFVTRSDSGKTQANWSNVPWKIRGCRTVKLILPTSRPWSIFDSKSGGDQFELPDVW